MIVGNGTANHHVLPCRLLLILAVDILDLVQRTKRNMTRAPGLVEFFVRSFMLFYGFIWTYMGFLWLITTNKFSKSVLNAEG